MCRSSYICYRDRSSGGVREDLLKALLRSFAVVLEKAVSVRTRMSEVETLKGDVAALQKRLRDANLDDSLPSQKQNVTAVVEEPKASGGAAAATPAGTVKTPHVPSYLSDSDDEKDKSPPEDVDMEAVGKAKTAGNDAFRTQQYKEAVTSYLEAIRMLQKGDLVDAKLFSNMAAAQLAVCVSQQLVGGEAGSDGSVLVLLTHACGTHR